MALPQLQSKSFQPGLQHWIERPIRFPVPYARRPLAVVAKGIGPRRKRPLIYISGKGSDLASRCECRRDMDDGDG